MENDAIQSDVSAGGESHEADLVNLFGGEAGEAEEPQDKPVEAADDDLDLETDEPEEVDEPDDEPTFDIKVNGKTMKLTQAQLIERAQKAEGSEVKFAEANKLRKEAEELKNVLPEREKQLNAALEHYIAQTKAIMPQEPNWMALLQADIQNGTRHHDVVKYQWEQKQRELALAEQTKAQLDQRNQAEQAASNQRRLADEMEKVREAIPAWKDPSKAKEGAAELGNFLKSKNIPEELIGSIDDHRVLLIVHQAMLYEKALERRNQAQNATRQTGTVARPTASQQARPRAQVARQQAAKAFDANPTIDTLAGFF